MITKRLLTGFVLALLAVLVLSTEGRATLADEGWGHSASFTVNNSSDEDMWGQWIGFEITSRYADFWNYVQPDARDVRFTLDDGETERVFYIETWDYANRYAKIWFRVHYIPANSSKDYIMWWDNPEAECRGWNGSYCDGTLFLDLGDPLETLYSVEGFYDVAITGGTFRTGDNSDEESASQVTDSSSAQLNLPEGAQVVKAYLIWGASSNEVDDTVTLNGNTVRADRTHQVVRPFDAERYYGGLADVTAIVKAQGSGTYTLTDLTIENDKLWKASYTVLGAWSLIVIYTLPDDLTVRHITLYEGFNLLDFEAKDYTLTGLRIGAPVDTKLTTITWEGDPDISGSDPYGHTEQLQVNGSTLSDDYNPSDNPYNSSSSTLQNDSTYGVDIDTYDISELVNSGDTQIQIHYETSRDLIINPAVVVSAKLSAIAGHVYEDQNGDGDSEDFQPLEGVEVKLFKSDGTLVATTTTDSYGRYYFANLEDGDYYVVVNSRTISSPKGCNQNHSPGEVWAEQTFVSTQDNSPSYARGLCDADADPSTPPEEVTSGVCFGGAYGNRSDDASSLEGAEHKIFAHLQDGHTLENLDFAFSFNVVVNTNDADDDPDNPRTAQGSLRQFIQNANAITGENYMRFVPAVPRNSENWWTVDLNLVDDQENLYALPPITDRYTTVDGTAYSYTDGKSIVDSNSGSVSAPGPVGTQETSLSPYQMPELEVNANDKGSIFTVKASNTTVKRVALYNTPAETEHYPAAIFVDSGTNVLIEDNFVGPRADGESPATDERAYEGIIVAPHSQVSISHNLVAYIGDTGITMEGEGEVKENYIHHTGRENPCGDSLTFEFVIGDSYLRSREQVVIESNYIEYSSAYGIESWGDEGAYTILNNTITKSGQGSDDGSVCGDGSVGTTELGGIRLFGSGSLVKNNVVFDNPGAGVVVVAISEDTPSTRNTISENSFYSNGSVAIDLDQTHTSGIFGDDNPNGDGVTPNDGVKNPDQQNEGLDYPVFTKAYVEEGVLHVEGFVGTPERKIEEVLTVEVYLADDDGNNNGEVFEGDGESAPHGEGKRYVGSCTTSSDGTFSCDMPLHALRGSYATAVAIDSNGNTSEFSANYKIVCILPEKINGYVYEDANHDGVRASGESGIEGVRVELWYYDGSEWLLEQTTTTDEEGYFEFSPQRTGTYRVIEDYDDGAGDDPNNGSDPPGYVSTTPNVVEVNWDGEKNVIVEFGDFHGSHLSGFVFNDKGDGSSSSSEANNALFDSNEGGIGGVKVKLCTDESCSTPLQEAYTGSDGKYEFWIAASEVSDGTKLYVVEEDLNGYTSTGSSVGATVVSDSTSTLSQRNTLELTYSSGNYYRDYNFGDVATLQIAPPQSYLAAAGDSLTISHTLNLGTPGRGALMLASQNGWEYTVYDDADCDGQPDGSSIPPDDDGYYVLNGGEPMPAGQYCVVVRVVVPSSVPDGTVEKLDVIAYEDWLNTSGLNGETGLEYDDVADLTDTITVTAGGSGTLRLEKWVRNVSEGEDFARSNTAKPCDVLEYKIEFKNIGAEVIKYILLSDNIPRGTELVTGQYNGGADDVEVVVEGESFYGSVSEEPDSDGVRFDGIAITIDLDKITGGQYRELQPGQEGYFLYRVRLEGDCN